MSQLCYNSYPNSCIHSCPFISLFFFLYPPMSSLFLFLPHHSFPIHGVIHILAHPQLRKLLMSQFIPDSWNYSYPKSYHHTDPNLSLNSWNYLGPIHGITQTPTHRITHVQLMLLHRPQLISQFVSSLMPSFRPQLIPKRRP